MPTRTLSQGECEGVARRHLANFVSRPGWRNASIAGASPLYGPGGGKIGYYEFKVSSPEFPDAGFIMISATTDDFPVVEFSEHGKTNFEWFQSQTTREFRLVRFGPQYLVAEDSQGHLLAECGKRPTIIPADLQRHVRNEFKSQAAQMLQVPVLPTPPTILERKGRAPEHLTYAEFKARAKPRRVVSPRVERAWTRVRLRDSLQCDYDYFYADGQENQSYYLQIPPNHPPNGHDHHSGCGATAWMNLIGWHARNWNPGLLQGAPKFADARVENLTMALHDFIGTYAPWWTFGSDQGFTWPDDMFKGFSFIQQQLSCGFNGWGREDWWDTDEPWVFEVARDLARNRRPFIVGYYEDMHYAIGLGIAECRTHGWQEHSWIEVYPAWSLDNSRNRWIPLDTIFAAYGVYTCTPIAIPAPAQRAPVSAPQLGPILSLLLDQ